MAQLVSLSDLDLAELRVELEGGKLPMVWFTSAAVGVQAGASAKIVAFADTAEGDYIQVRPTGSKDVLSFSPVELTRTRPPRRKAATKPAAKPAARPVRPAEPVAAPAKPAPKPAPAPKPPPPPPTPEPVTPAPAKPKRLASRAVAAKPAEVIVTLASTVTGEWTVDVVVGKKRAVRNAAVAPAEVAKAAKALPAAVGEAIDAALVTARTQQQARVAALQAELEQAQRTLRELG